MLVVVKTLNRAGPGQPMWDLPFMSAKGNTECPKYMDIYTYSANV